MDIRDRKGRFAEGSAGGPGRPPRQTERDYLRATLTGCSVDDWVEIVRQAVTSAKAGDAKARDWLSQYMLGNPVGIAPTSFDLAVDDAAGVDPVETRAAQKRMLESINKF